jgi:ribonuclease Y
MILAEATDILLGVFVGLIVGGGAIAAAVFVVMKGKVEAARKSSAGDAEVLKENAKKEADNILTQARLEAQGEALTHREKIEQDLEKDRREIKEVEKRIAKREESIEQKFEMLDKKADQLETRQKEIDAIKQRTEELEAQRTAVLEEERAKLSELAEMTAEEARRELLTRLDTELVAEKAERIKNMVEKSDEEVGEKAKWMVSQAICRLASEHTGETTTSTVEIPSDEVKGRIIGREGRNIRHFERVTGVDVIVDDTPGLVVLIFLLIFLEKLCRVWSIVS